jgi:hypothetical protein
MVRLTIFLSLEYLRIGTGSTSLGCGNAASSTMLCSRVGIAKALPDGPIVVGVEN